MTAGKLDGALVLLVCAAAMLYPVWVSSTTGHDRARMTARMRAREWPGGVLYLTAAAVFCATLVHG